jgi:hypothetical protein
MQTGVKNGKGLRPESSFAGHVRKGWLSGKIPDADFLRAGSNAMPSIIAQRQ